VRKPTDGSQLAPPACWSHDARAHAAPVHPAIIRSVLVSEAGSAVRTREGLVRSAARMQEDVVIPNRETREAFRAAVPSLP
jgi:hypothetical protein